MYTIHINIQLSFHWSQSLFSAQTPLFHTASWYRLLDIFLFEKQRKPKYVKNIMFYCCSSEVSNAFSIEYNAKRQLASGGIYTW